jgi:hypothetical protein
MKVINNNNGTFSLIREITLTQEDIDTLARIIIRGYWEFRGRSDDSEYCREGINRESVCRLLESYGLLDDGDGMAWHLTFYPTDLGKELIMSIKD